MAYLQWIRACQQPAGTDRPEYAKPRLDLRFIPSANFSLGHKHCTFMAQGLVPARCSRWPCPPPPSTDHPLDNLLRKHQTACLSKSTGFPDLLQTVCERVGGKLLGAAPTLGQSLRGCRKLLARRSLCCCCTGPRLFSRAAPIVQTNDMSHLEEQIAAQEDKIKQAELKLEAAENSERPEEATYLRTSIQQLREEKRQLREKELLTLKASGPQAPSPTHQTCNHPLQHSRI